ncbi:MAG: sugar ABC transporter permease [Nocardioides sp.]|uniref:carbohydrate ABC transporter permease n=1 Tax=Nocardioides sp. TaxID=35761 RepID=UPI0039E6EE1B
MSNHSTAAPRRRRRLRSLTRRDRVILTIMVAIPTLIELVLVWLPALASVGLSFTKWNGIWLSDIKWTGTANYDYVLHTYTPFWPALRHNIYWLVSLSLVATPLGLALAVFLDGKIRGSRIYQSIFFMPVMLSMALVGIIWQLVYDRDQGLINGVLGTAGHDGAIDWLGNSSIALWSAIVAAIWKHAGYVMILYLAGLKGVDPSLREAASLDGANGWQTFWRIVFPTMRPINIVIVVITLIESLRAFDIVWVLNKGQNGLELLSALIVRNLVGEGQDIGVGSAIAVILMVISLVPIVWYLARVFGKEKA